MGRRLDATSPETRQKIRHSNSKYRNTEKGRSVRKALSINRRANKIRSTPAWSDLNAIGAFIKDCPEGFHLDHIVPLKGDDVCGLHVLENLQHLPAQENMAKSNKIDPLTLEANICVLPQYRSYKA